MPGGELVAGVDCSTQATKVVVVDAGSGAVVATGRADHVVSGERGARESDPRQWWDALRTAIALTGRGRDIRAISVAGQQHGLVTLGWDHEPVRPAMLWNDTRSSTDAEALVAALGAPTWAERTGSRPLASFTVTKWAWLRRNEPASVSATEAVRLPHDYLTERLTGHGVTDRGDASGTGWWSTTTGGYDDTILGLLAVELDGERLPTVLEPFTVAGTVRVAAAEDLGLGPDVVVGPGTGDNMAAALGLGLTAGQPAISLGTSGTVFMVSPQRTADQSGVVAGFADATGRFLPLACTLNCTLAIDRVARWLHLGRDDVEASGDVVVLPYLDGERTPNLPEASGVITGLRPSTSPGQILLAAYEGAVASLVDALDAIADQAGGTDGDAPLVVVGGGAEGRTWRDVVGRLSGRPLLIPAARELTALGAAVQATAVWRDEAPGSVAGRWQTNAGTLVDPVPRDDGRLQQIRSVRDTLAGTPLLGRDP
jgi:xylulokinase